MVEAHSNPPSDRFDPSRTAALIAGGSEGTPALIPTVLSIFGMRGNECRERITEVLESQAGVQDALVSLHRARATVVHTPLCTPDVLIRAVLATGYAAALITQSWPA